MIKKRPVAPNEALPEDYKHMLTVGQLLDFIERFNIPRDAKVFYQRIEDDYFIGQDISGFGGPDGPLLEGTKSNGWSVIKKMGETYHRSLKWNEDLDSGEYDNKEEYPNASPELWEKYSDQDLLDLRDEYIAANSPVKYKDDNNLYIDAHY